ncbi:MAG: 3,5-cyclic adenosine monophosphate phosphodiesterase CpdA, partial [Verrucomicrobiota bacterium]
MLRPLALCFFALVAAAAEPAVERLFVLGDWGWADPDMERQYSLVRQNADLQRAVAKAMATQASKEPVSAVVTTGDNFYPSGVKSATDPRWTTSFEQVYAVPALQVPWIASLGNHDHDHENSAQAQVDYSTKSKGRWIMPARYYAHHLPVQDIRVIVLDACSLSPLWNRRYFSAEAERETAAQWAWVEAELTKPARWKVVVGHLPIRSHGIHSTEPEYIRRLTPLLEKHRVQLYLNGHNHHAELVKEKGVAYVTCGNGSDLYPIGSGQGSEF